MVATDDVTDPLERMILWERLARESKLPDKEKAEAAIEIIYEKAFGRKRPAISWHAGPTEAMASAKESGIQVLAGEPSSDFHDAFNWDWNARGTALNTFGIQRRAGISVPPIRTEAVARLVRRSLFGSREIYKPSCPLLFSWTNWISLYFSVKQRQEVAMGPEFRTIAEAWAQLSMEACGGVFDSDTCFLFNKPTEMHLDQANRPHRMGGPCIVFADGSASFAYNGVQVERAVVEDKDYITERLIDQEQNLELKRIYIDIFGFEKYVSNGSFLVQNDECGELYCRVISGDEAIVAVKVKNSTAEPDGTFKHYLLRVPPTTRTAREGVAWTFNMSPHDYSPALET